MLLLSEKKTIFQIKILLAISTVNMAAKNISKLRSPDNFFEFQETISYVAQQITCVCYGLCVGGMEV